MARASASDARADRVARRRTVSSANLFRGGRELVTQRHRGGSVKATLGACKSCRSHSPKLIILDGIGQKTRKYLRVVASGRRPSSRHEGCSLVKRNDR